MNIPKKRPGPWKHRYKQRFNQRSSFDDEYGSPSYSSPTYEVAAPDYSYLHKLLDKEIKDARLKVRIIVIFSCDT